MTTLPFFAKQPGYSLEGLMDTPISKDQFVDTWSTVISSKWGRPVKR
jgi:hypothetical protein